MAELTKASVVRRLFHDLPISTRAAASHCRANVRRRSRRNDRVADLGPDYFDRHHADNTIRRLLKRLADLGCNVAPMAHAV